jgi:tetratricopeptide (TPR) repeat protein
MDALELLKARRIDEAEREFLREIESSTTPAASAAKAALAAQRASEPALAVRLYRRAEELSPGDPELPHSRGLAHLELGEVGLAQHAQAKALALDPEHFGARAQRAALLQAFGDDAGAARELSELLRRIGPNPALSARLIHLEQAAQRAASRRLLGKPLAQLAASPLVTSAFARAIGDPHLFRASFAELRMRGDRLELVFESLDASMGRSDLSYGGSTVEEDGRRVPLDEFNAAAIVFLSETLGIESFRARRIVSFLLSEECGMNAWPIAAATVGWLVEGQEENRKYGLFAQL